MTAKVTKDSTSAPAAKPHRIPIPTTKIPNDLRDGYGLSRSTLARMLSVSEATLAKWEKGTAIPDDAVAAKLKRLADILAGLARVMKKRFIPTWLTSPNAACEGRAPVDLLAQGD